MGGCDAERAKWNEPRTPESELDLALAALRRMWEPCAECPSPAYHQGVMSARALIRIISAQSRCTVLRESATKQIDELIEAIDALVNSPDHINEFPTEYTNARRLIRGRVSA